MKTSTQPTRIIIVGGVAGGASAAAKARRVDENAGRGAKEVHKFERVFGGATRTIWMILKGVHKK